MSDVTGPTSTLPGAAHDMPKGTMCDDHPDRPAVARVQGETDSFGCEMHDLCADCLREYREEIAAERLRPQRCDWCREEAVGCREARDYEEGMAGRVYTVCPACLKRREERLREEERNRPGYWDDPGDDYDDWDDGATP